MLQTTMTLALCERSSGERMLMQWITKEEPPYILQLLMEISWPLNHSSAKIPLILVR